jgi:transposase
MESGKSRLVEDFRKSGQTQTVFCKQNQVNIHTLRYHLYKKNKRSRKVLVVKKGPKNDSISTPFISFPHIPQHYVHQKRYPVTIISGQFTLRELQAFMRKNFDGLSGIVTGSFRKNPLRDGLFVFVNKRRDRMKLLIWDRHGYWLLYKRLEAGRFQMPPTDSTTISPESLTITYEQLLLIIEGIDLQSVKRRKRYVIPQNTQ